MLRATPFLARASDDGLARLARSSTVRRYDRGDFLFRAGEPVTRIHVIRSGQVAATVSSANGATLTFHVAEAGESAGHVDLLVPGCHTASAQVLSPVSAVAVPAERCIELLAAEAAVALDYARDLAGIVSILNESMADLVFLDLERRLARMLLDAPSVDGLVPVTVTQSELAARLGAARQSVNQALARLARRGYVRLESSRSIRIVDPDALKAFVAGTGHLT